MSVLRIRFAVACIAIGWMPAAWAGEGALEISQACVATGCFAGDTPGFPVSITASGSYRLTSNLVVPDAQTDAISVTFVGVSLDLGGFAIRGPTQCSGTPLACTPTGGGVGVSGARRTHVFNGRVEGMGSIGIAPGGDGRVWDVTVAHNGEEGLYLSRGDSVRDSTVVSNGGNGIAANTGGGLTEVSGCTVRDNGSHGIVASNGVISDSIFHGNGGAGISGSAAYKGNLVSSNTTLGVSGGEAIGCNSIDNVAVCPP